jgi:hypothetical protein
MTASSTISAIRAAFGSGSIAVKVGTAGSTFSGATKDFYVINEVFAGH